MMNLRNKSLKQQLTEKQTVLENKITTLAQDGLTIKIIEGKGRGIITTRDFHANEFVVEYVGDLIDHSTAIKRERSHKADVGDYMFFFKYKDKSYCIDATEETDRLGRLINHSKKNSLLYPKILQIQSAPRLIFFAKCDIPKGTEITYDYGDRRKSILAVYPWLLE